LGAWCAGASFVRVPETFGLPVWVHEELRATITTLGTDGVTVIGTYDLATMAPISTPDALNGEAFRGIESSSADIGYLELSGGFILAHSLEVAVPHRFRSRPRCS
jgi:hypothetical protein